MPYYFSSSKKQKKSKKKKKKEWRRVHIITEQSRNYPEIQSLRKSETFGYFVYNAADTWHTFL